MSLRYSSLKISHNENDNVTILITKVNKSCIGILKPVHL